MTRMVLVNSDAVVRPDFLPPLVEATNGPGNVGPPIRAWASRRPPTPCARVERRRLRPAGREPPHPADECLGMPGKMSDPCGRVPELHAALGVGGRWPSALPSGARTDGAPAGPRRVLFVQHLGDVFGGTERSLLNLVRRLDPARFRAVVAHPPRGALWDALAAALGDGAGAAVAVERIAWDGFASPWRRPVAFVRGVLALRRAIRETGAALVHANSWWAARLATPAAASLGVPSIAHVRDAGFAAPRGPAAGLTRAADHLVRRALNVPTSLLVRPDRLIAVSRFIAEVLAGIAFVDRRRVEVVYDGVDLPPTPPADGRGASFRARHGIAPEDLLIGAVGRLDPGKGLPLVLEATHALRARGLPARAAIVGGAWDPTGHAHAEELRARAQELGILESVTFTGHVADVWSVYAALDVLVVPSLAPGGYGEGAPNALFEGLAAGLPVVASRSGGLPELVRDGVDGLLVPAGDPEALAAALERLLRDPPLRRRLAAEARRQAGETFSTERCAARTQEIYDEVLVEREGYRLARASSPLG